jgi:hypothetical protein
MPTEFTTVFHFRPELTQQEVTLRLARSLTCFAVHGLEPYPFNKQAWIEGTDGVLGSISLRHPFFAESTGDDFWGAGFMTVPSPHTQSTLVSMNTPAKLNGGTAEAWSWLLGLIEPLCGSLQVDLAMANGIIVTPRGLVRSGHVAGPEVAPGHVPYALYPWMYFSPRRLTAEPTLADKLAALPAARTSPIEGGGWVLQAHNIYSGQLPKALMDAYATTFNLPNVWWEGVK